MTLKSSRFEPQNWAYYAPGAHAPAMYDTAELQRIVRKAAKAANQRLRTLEKAGETQYAYKAATKHLLKETGAKRYKERTKTQSRESLIKEFVLLRDFLSAQTSTITGIKIYRDVAYEKAKAIGFTGEKNELSQLFRTYMTEELEKFIGSDLLYKLILSNDKSALEKIRNEWLESKQREKAEGLTDEEKKQLKAKTKLEAIMLKYRNKDK